MVKLSQKFENETKKKKVELWNFQVNNVGLGIIVKYHLCKHVLKGGPQRSSWVQTFMVNEKSTHFKFSTDISVIG